MSAFRFFRMFLAVFLFFVLAFAVPSAPAFDEPPVARTEEAAHWMTEARLAGLHREQKRKTEIAEAFRTIPVRFRYENAYMFRSTMLYALAQMGGTEAVPIILEYIGRTFAPGGDASERYKIIGEKNEILSIEPYAKVVIARLEAGEATKNMRDGKARAAAQVTQFLQKLDVTLDSLNAGVTAFNKELKQFHAGMPGPDSQEPMPNLETFAIRELADMAYHDESRTVQHAPQMSKIQFTLDKPSALKMRMAPLSRSARIDALVQELATQSPFRREVIYSQQLLADEEEPAYRAVAAQMKRMDEHPNEYPKFSRDNLPTVLWGMSDPKLLPLTLQERHDNIYGIVGSGLKQQFVAGY